MEQAPATNPFQPGAGSYPPVLAGRAEEQTRLASLVRALADWRPGQPLQAIHIIEAPRGMGKTVLLEMLTRLAETNPAFRRVAVLRTPASNLATVDDIARHVEPAPSWYHAAWRWFVGLRWLGLSLQRPRQREGRGAMRAAFDRRRHKPLLLMVDEAQTLPADVCHVLLNEFQNRSGRQPCALVLAGTPALGAYLLSDEVNASFVERAPVVAPGLLSREDSATALHVPAWNAWDIDPATLATAVEESYGYPYFLQHWGKALWDAGVARRVIDQAALDVARGVVDAARTALYTTRFDEFEDFAIREGIDRRTVLGAVQAAAREATQSDATMTTSSLGSLLEDAGLDSNTAVLLRRQMVQSGFLVREGDLWRPGISSLAAYIADHPRATPPAGG